jgi:DNA replication licensing factor MCM7
MMSVRMFLCNVWGSYLKADMEADLALSRHVLYVHKHTKTPETTIRPVDPITIKNYIAAARNVRHYNSVKPIKLSLMLMQLHPTVPRELTSYIVEAYVSLR